MALAFGATVSAELVNGRFTTTRKITVEIYDRSNPGGTPPEDNYWTDWIKEGVLRDLNIEVEFVPVPRWTEVEVLNNRLAQGTLQTFASLTAINDSHLC